MMSGEIASICSRCYRGVWGKHASLIFIAFQRDRPNLVCQRLGKTLGRSCRAGERLRIARRHFVRYSFNASSHLGLIAGSMISAMAAVASRPLDNGDVTNTVLSPRDRTMAWRKFASIAVALPLP